MIKQITTAARRIETIFTPDDQWVESVRKIVWQAAQRHLGSTHTFVREKGTADYICTTEASAQQVVGALYTNGYQRNILSTVKYRTRGGEKEYVHSAWVYDPADTYTQHDVFLWERDNKVDIYGHREPSVRHPDAHLDLSTGTHGDPDRRLRDTLDAAGIGYTTVDNDTLK
jgi:hypothetical protein